MNSSFKTIFHSLTTTHPFPWQEALYKKFCSGEIPETLDLPTGLGKTSVVAIWLSALVTNPDKIPRRLVYVVNRRTVVDQTTAEAERLRDALQNKPALAEFRKALASLCALPLPKTDAPPLAISTLRGQFADNCEWCADPSRPAVIVGTVDMIGSGLLFSRYTRGFKTRPLHAGFLGQDVLLVHDEAHLEPAFQKLLESIVAAQNSAADPRKLRVMQLTATSRSESPNTQVKPFGLDVNPDDKDTDNETVRKRINAVKRLSLVSVTKTENGKDKANDDNVRDKILELARHKKDSNRAILVFIRSVKAATKIKDELDKHKCNVAPLTGTMRGKERDELVTGNRVFQRFLSARDRAPGVEATPGTVFLVATSAGEVGVNISADDIICDLSTFESMAQRFGRVNRFGDRDDSEIQVVYRTNLQTNYNEGLEKAKSASKDPEKKVADYERKNQSLLRIIKTLALMEKLKNNASPVALNGLPISERIAAFSPPPELRRATEIQFDAWALTSIREHIAARPQIAPYLHGEAEWQPAETHVAWREELDVVTTPELRRAYPPSDLLEDFPLKPHELLRDTTERVFDQLASLLRKRQDNGAPLPAAWLMGEDGTVTVYPLARLVSDEEAAPEEEEENAEAEGDDGGEKKAEKVRKSRAIAALANATLILPASLGGIDKDGLLTGNASGSAEKTDVADIVARSANDRIPVQRCRVWSNTPDVPDALANVGFRLIRFIDDRLDEENTEDSEETSLRYWLWLEAKASSPTGARIDGAEETLETHANAVAANASAIAAKCFPDKSALAVGEPDLRRCVILAARLHDCGKNRAQWQRNLGNLAYDSSKPETILAKAAPGMRGRNVAEHYRHEFGSLSDAGVVAELAALDDAERDIVLHLVAAHHGRARPHFPADEIFDYASVGSPETLAALAAEVPRRFARLQQRYGRWGLAWLESVLRASDYAASAGIFADASDERVQDAELATAGKSPEEKIVPTVSLAVNPANPGHYFACCGLFELAERLAPNGNTAEPALAWFDQEPTTRQWRFHLANTLSLGDLLERITAAQITAADSSEEDGDDKDEDLDEKEGENEEKDASAPPLLFDSPFNLHLDWWTTASVKTSALKAWAGSMKVHNIARSMSFAIQRLLSNPDYVGENILTHFQITHDLAKIEKRQRKIEQTCEASLKKAEEKKAEALKSAEAEKSGEKLAKEKIKIVNKFEATVAKAKAKRERDLTNITTTAKKIEPFYFDANRGPNAHSRDVGFAVNDLKWATFASPAVELLTLVGLQRAIPAPVLDAPRNFDYSLWTLPLPISLLPAAVNGLLPDNSRRRFRFESWFRTGQRKHKAFLTARTIQAL